MYSTKLQGTCSCLTPVFFETELSPFTVTIVCKQLEGDNKLLEEQLKSRGRRSCHPSQRTSDADSAKTSSRGLSNETPTSSLDISNDSKQEPTTTAGNSGSQLPKKEINILEDLDKEFNKQRLEMGIGEGQKTGVLRSISPKRDRKSLGSEVRASKQQSLYSYSLIPRPPNPAHVSLLCKGEPGNKAIVTPNRIMHP